VRGLCHLHPDFVTRVVFTENIIPGLGIPGEADWETLNSRWWHHAFHATPDLPESLIEGRESTYLGYLYRRWTFDPSTFTPDFFEAFVTSYSQPGALRAGFAYYRALEQDALANSKFAERQFEFPAMVITARHQVNEILQKQLRPVLANYKGWIFENCAHFISIECPFEEAYRIDEFLQD
jgi:pimeloyl-ACP methyl ester carboxylesterase